MKSVVISKSKYKIKEKLNNLQISKKCTSGFLDKSPKILISQSSNFKKSTSGCLDKSPKGCPRPDKKAIGDPLGVNLRATCTIPRNSAIGSFQNRGIEKSSITDLAIDFR